MNYEDVANAMEIMREKQIKLLNSREYRIGIKISRAITDFKNHNFLAMFQREIGYKRIAKFNCCKEIPSDNFRYGKYPDLQKKFVVYTCITGGYDIIQEPLYIHPSIDYILYTDNQNCKSSVWQIRPIKDEVARLGDNILINRFYKFNPQNLFDQYDYSLYLDGNIRVISDIRNMVNRLNNTLGLALHRHSSRNCIYKEAEVCRIEKKGNYDLILKQLEKYRREGFPENFGLYEANVILSDLKNSNANIVFSSWWKEFLNSKSFRDQISLPYIIWKCGYKFEDIGNLGINMHNNPKLEKVTHK